MGQAWASLQDKQLQGSRWKEQQMKKITDSMFDRLTAEHSESEKHNNEALSFEEVYSAVLCIYNGINKYLPGPHYDPPTKESLKAMMNEHDVNLVGLLDREEFAGFIQKLMVESMLSIGLRLIITFMAAPVLAMAAKRATQGLPGVRKVVRKVPNAVYAAAITLGVLLIQKSAAGLDVE